MTTTRRPPVHVFAVLLSAASLSSINLSELPKMTLNCRGVISVNHRSSSSAHTNRIAAGTTHSNGPASLYASAIAIA